MTFFSRFDIYLINSVFFPAQEVIIAGFFSVNKRRIAVTKLFKSLFMIGLVCVLGLAASRAFFSDTETSGGNRFETGSLDLKVDNQCHYYQLTAGGYQDVGCPQESSWQLTDLENGIHKFFSFADVKPGDWGENTTSLHIYNNDAWACLTVSALVNDDNGLTGPEARVDASADIGELADYLYLFAWKDDNGDNQFQPSETPLFNNLIEPASVLLNGVALTLADSSFSIFGDPMLADNTYYLGLAWCAGTMTVDLNTGEINCNGQGMGDEAQTDSLETDISIYIEQVRNNPNFICPGTIPSANPSPSPSPSVLLSPSPSPSPSVLLSPSPIPSFFPSPSPSPSDFIFGCMNDTECSDGLSCTTDRCNVGLCEHTIDQMNICYLDSLNNSCLVTNVCNPNANPTYNPTGCEGTYRENGFACSTFSCILGSGCDGYTCQNGSCTPPTASPSPSASAPLPSFIPSPLPSVQCFQDSQCYSGGGQCTSDVCMNGVCMHFPLNGQSCSVNGSPGQCVFGACIVFPHF